MAAAAPGHPAHETCRRFVARHAPAIAGHASLEAFSVLTRLPVVGRLPGAAAARLLQAHFPRAIWPSVASMERFVEDCGGRGITGGAVYDALVALAASDHGARLVSLDRRAATTYRAMGVETVAPAEIA